MTNSPGGRSPDMRASDRDREHAAEILREAAGDGRLGLDELDERLDAVYAAKTYAELEPITRDLPHTPGPAAPAPVAGPPVPAARDYRYGARPTSSSAVAVMSGFERTGRWGVPEHFTSVAFMGGGRLDLREAEYAAPTTTITAVAFMGGIEIIVPEDADVQVSGIGIMCGFEHRASGLGRDGAPRIVINGVAFMGGIDVRRLPQGADPNDRRPGQWPGHEIGPGHPHGHEHHHDHRHDHRHSHGHGRSLDR